MRDRPDIYGFDDFRDYLKEVIRTRGDRKNSWSHRAWAKRLGFRDSSSLTKILNGQRNPGPAAVQAFVASLRLDEREGRHFQLLVKLAKAGGDPTLKALLESMIRDNVPSGDGLDWARAALRKLMAARILVKGEDDRICMLERHESLVQDDPLPKN